MVSSRRAGAGRLDCTMLNSLDGLAFARADGHRSDSLRLGEQRLQPLLVYLFTMT